MESSFKLASKIKNNRTDVIEFIDEFKRHYELYKAELHCWKYYIDQGDFDDDDKFKWKYYIDQYTTKEILDKLFSYDIKYVFDYTDLKYDLVGQVIIFSFECKEHNKIIFCRVSLCDDLSPNRWDDDDIEYNIDLRIEYSTKLKDFINYSKN